MLYGIEVSPALISNVTEAVREEVKAAHDLTVTEAAKILRESRPTLSSLLNARADLSGEMALPFEKAFGVDMDT